MDVVILVVLETVFFNALELKFILKTFYQESNSNLILTVKGAKFRDKGKDNIKINKNVFMLSNF